MSCICENDSGDGEEEREKRQWKRGGRRSDDETKAQHQQVAIDIVVSRRRHCAMKWSEGIMDDDFAVC